MDKSSYYVTTPIYYVNDKPTSVTLIQRCLPMYLHAITGQKAMTPSS